MTSPTSPTTLIKLPAPLHSQFKALAEARGVSMVDLVQRQVREAIDAGEIPFSVPGYVAVRDDDVTFIEVAGQHLPAVPNQKAALIAAVFLAAGGEPDPKLGFEMPPGRPVYLDLGVRGLLVGRAGRGVRFVLKEKEPGEAKVSSKEGIMFSAPAGLVAGLGHEIFRELRNH